MSDFNFKTPQDSAYDGITSGEVLPSKAVIVDANEAIDEITITTLKLGESGSGVALTASAAEINKTDGIATNAYLQVAESRSFTETAGAGTYTATVPIPSGGTVIDVCWRNTALWTAATSATLDIGDGDDADGFFAAIDLKSAPAADTAEAPGGVSNLLQGTGSGAYKGKMKYYNDVGTITASVVTVGETGDAGRSIMLVTYVTPTAVAATKA